MNAGKSYIKNKIKIIYVIDYFYYEFGGTEKQLVELIKRIDKEKFEPLLIILSKANKFPKNLVPCQYHLLDYKGFLSFNILKILKQLITIINKAQGCIVQTFFEESAILTFIISSFLQKKPVLIYSKRDIGEAKGLIWYHWLYEKLKIVVLKKFNYVIANSDSVKNFVSKKYKLDKKKIKRIYNGVNIIDEFELKNDQKKIEKDTFLIGLCANIRPVKRIDVFLNALGVLDKRGIVKNYLGLVIGEVEESELETIKNLVKRNNLKDRVIFTGITDNVPQYLTTLHVGVLCSDQEGLSNAILEYMAYSLPVVATDAGGNKELVTLQNGFLIEKGDYNTLAECLEIIYKDERLRTELGANSKRIVEERHKWESQIREYEQLYFKCAGLIKN